MKNEASYKVFL